MLVLLVEDSKTIGKLVSDMLTRHGHACLSVMNGQEALQCLEAMPDIQLVITDLEMPVMDGLTLIKEMNARCEWEDIPIIISTSRSDASTVKKAIKLGCQHYLIKPPSESQLLEKLSEALGTEVPVLQEKSIMLNHFGIEEDTYNQIFQVFAKEVEETIRIIEEDSTIKNQEKIEHALLQIRDSATMVGAERLSKQFKKLTLESPQEGQQKMTLRQTSFLRELRAIQKIINTESGAPT